MKIAVVGATGLVGREMVKILLDKKLVECKDLDLFASSASEGKIIKYSNNEMVVKSLSKKNVKKYDFALFCAGKQVSKDYASIFIDRGAVVIDNSSAFRREKGVPLVVPEVNLKDAMRAKLIANPNCSTIGLCLPLFYLNKIYPIKRIVVSTYQAVSGAGQKGIDDLLNNTNYKFEEGIKDNIIPKIDIPLLNGYTFEEDKMSFELKKIFNNRYLKISATCVRVPVTNCHSESVNIEFECQPNLQKIKNLLRKCKGVVLFDNLKQGKYPMPQLAHNSDDVYIGRIRHDFSNKNAINCFLCFDNIRKGAALNAVQILQGLIEK